MELRAALDFVVGEVGRGFAVRWFESGGKPSALVCRAGAVMPFRVVLNAHLDVVPGADEQFAPRRDGDRLYGRGTHDMKAAAVVLATVFRELADELPYDIALQLVTDEEVGGADGTGHQLAAGVRAGFVLIGEQSGLRVVAESKGICQGRLSTAGLAAHAAYPWMGRNALLDLTAGIDRLLAAYPVPTVEAWATTVNLARIETPNLAVNQVPAAATAWFDLRYPPSDGHFAGRTAEEIALHLSEVTGVAAHVDALGPPHRADPDGAEVRLLQQVVRATGYDGDLLRKHGAADGRYYHALGIDAVIFGPGGGGQHGPAEYLDVTTLRPYYEALRGFLLGLDR
ncbi:peptidase M20 [Paractinoplanes rishiriensis]|uniref:Peptidase M20 n=1 Tax=Paractinoplanes rishiriensis TaxID=1050105 RepID=A0A919JWM8_9ACTN|nr:peptidase M20 [Actinoplanes rishiriensis]